MQRDEHDTDVARRSGLELPCAPPDRPIRERLDEPLGEEGEFCRIDGRPCIVFAEWDYAEDWSGEFVRVIAPRTVIPEERLDAHRFWALVRSLQEPRAEPR